VKSGKERSTTTLAFHDLELVRTQNYVGRQDERGVARKIAKWNVGGRSSASRLSCGHLGSLLSIETKRQCMDRRQVTTKAKKDQQQHGDPSSKHFGRRGSRHACAAKILRSPPLFLALMSGFAPE
jgi:hypothetical protein